MAGAFWDGYDVNFRWLSDGVDDYWSGGRRTSGQAAAALAGLEIRVGAYQRRKNRKQQKKMQEKAIRANRMEQRRLAAAMIETRTPPPPKKTRMAPQIVPAAADWGAGRRRTPGLAIRRRGGTRSLRVGSSGNYGVRV